MQEQLPPPVFEFVWKSWSLVSEATSAENTSTANLAIRVAVTFLTYVVFYTRTVGVLMTGIWFLVAHHWYVLASTCSVVILLLSSVVLISFEWMWQWQAKLMSFFFQGSAARGRRQVIVDEDYGEGDQQFDSWQVWSKKLCRGALILLGYTVYCWLNIKLDHKVFWAQYDHAHPKHNLELFFVNCLQAAPILVGAGFTLYKLDPRLIRWHGMPISSAAGETGMDGSFAIPTQSFV